MVLFQVSLLTLGSFQGKQLWAYKPITFDFNYWWGRESNVKRAWPTESRTSQPNHSCHPPGVGFFCSQHRWIWHVMRIDISVNSFRNLDWIILFRLIGSVPSLVLKGISDELYGPSSSLTFGSYFAIIAPTMIINLLILWAMLQISLLGLSWLDLILNNQL